MNIKQRILSEAEKDYKKFSASLIPNINNVLGVRLPVLRKIAKEIYETENREEFLNIDECEFMEERMLQGMVIGLLKQEPHKIFRYIKNFVPKIDNWAVCDSFCTGLKFTKQNKKLMWDFIQPYLNSDKEFEIRFGMVMILSYFIEEDYIDKVFKIIDKFKDERYYAKMAVAWAVSVCYVKFSEKTLKYLQNSKLEKWTYNKSIQKICESYRVSKNDKEVLKGYKH